MPDIELVEVEFGRRPRREGILPYLVGVSQPYNAAEIAPLFAKKLKREIAREVRKNVLSCSDWLRDYQQKKSRYWTRHNFQWYDDAVGKIEWNLDVSPDVEASKANVLKARIAGQLAPPMIWCRKAELTSHNLDPKEMVARGLLREIVGDEAYHRYIRTGIISMRGSSGMTYVIRGGHSEIETRLSDKPNVVHERICVQFKEAGIPYTDAVIMRVLLVRNDEKALRAMSNVRTT